MEISVKKSFEKKIEKYIKSYLNKLKYENKSINTINSYKNTLYSFLEYIKQLDEDIEFKTIKPSNIYEYFEYKEFNMNKQGELSNSSKRLLYTHLKTFFSFIEIESGELYDFSKMFNSIKIKNKKREPKGLNEEDETKLLKIIEKLKTTENNYIIFRNALIIKTILYTGLRVSEMLTLRYKDYEMAENEIITFKIRGKGEKERVVYLKRDKIEDEYEELLNYKNEDDFICSSKNNKLLPRTYINKILEIFCKKANIKNYTVHELRHTFAKRFLERGGNIVNLQRLLGHSDIETTMIYANPHQQNILNDFAKIY